MPRGKAAANFPVSVLTVPLIFLGLWLVGVVLWGGPADPDVRFPLSRVVGVFLIFCAWGTATLSWGRIWSAWIGFERFGPWTMALALGSASASVSAMILSQLGLIGYAWFPLLFGLLFLGTCAAAAQAYRGKLSPLRLPWSEWPEFITTLILLAFFASWLGNASLANGTTDPLFYHLLGPRDWVDAGRIQFRPGLQVTFLCTYWEYVILWGIHLLGAPHGRGLIEGQLFAQWLHLFFGLGGVAIGIGALLELLRVPKQWLAVALFPALLPRIFATYAIIAKNDSGIASWNLAALLILCHLENARPRDLAVAGVLLGMALEGKAITFVSVAGFSFAWLLFSKRTSPGRLAGRSLALLGGALAAILPIAARSAAYGMAAFYPFTNPPFSSHWFGPSDFFTNQSTAGHWVRTPLELLKNLWAVFRQSVPVWPFLPLLPLVTWKQGRRVAKLLLTGCAIAILAFCMRDFPAGVSPPGYQRWVGLGLILVPSLAMIPPIRFLEWARDRYNLKRTTRAILERAVPVCLMLAFAYLFSGSIYWFKAYSTVFEHTPDEAIRMPDVHVGGAEHAWLRLNATPSDRIITTGDQLFYYLAGLDVYSALHHPALDEAFDGIHRGEQAVEALREFGAKYVVDVVHWASRYYGPFAELITKFTESQHPEAIVYMDSQGEIIDVDRLVDETNQACVAPAGTPEDRYLRLFEFERRSPFTYLASNPLQFPITGSKY